MALFGFFFFFFWMVQSIGILYLWFKEPQGDFFPAGLFHDSNALDCSRGSQCLPGQKTSTIKQIAHYLEPKKLPKKNKIAWSQFACGSLNPPKMPYFFSLLARTLRSAVLLFLLGSGSQAHTYKGDVPRPIRCLWSRNMCRGPRCVPTAWIFYVLFFSAAKQMVVS